MFIFREPDIVYFCAKAVKFNSAATRAASHCLARGFLGNAILLQQQLTASGES